MTEAKEYQSRLWVGFALAGVTALILFLDPPPLYPGLLLLFLVLGPMTLAELYHLLATLPRQPYALVVVAVALVHVANWLPHLWPFLGTGFPAPEPLPTLLGALAVVFAGAFTWEMVNYREPGGAIIRVALTSWMALYLGLFPSFLVQLRWRGTDPSAWFNMHGALLVALAAFMPKVGDIGAYFVGKRLGRHRMTPTLSPKKTWEGLAGGLLASVLASLSVELVYPPLFGEWWRALGFGLTVGVAGVVGDLAESLIKRDAGQKDASQVVPGFGGLLDVIDSVLFAAPVAYLWLN
jgi:phosphatidate cytidylyltransferase